MKYLILLTLALSSNIYAFDKYLLEITQTYYSGSHTSTIIKSFEVFNEHDSSNNKQSCMSFSKRINDTGNYSVENGQGHTSAVCTLVTNVEPK